MMSEIKNPKVFVVVLAWNYYNHTKRCLESLRTVEYDNLNVLVVDNNSSDKTSENIKKDFPEFNILTLSKNLKFSGGNNEGVNHLNPEKDDFIIFLNNDTIVSKNFVKKLINPLLEDKKAIISTPKILYSSNINKIWYAGGVVNLWFGIIKHIGIRDFDGPKYSFKTKTDYASGCCFCIKFDDFRKLYFDNDFSMYCEDVDLSLRARKMNRFILYVPDSVILHNVSQTLGEHSFNKNFKKLKGQLKLFWRHASPFQLIFIFIFWLIIHIPLQALRWLYFRLANAK
tara:strand:+ start:551 stop:1405 length:855 start_codon:yes stop_codon:yes gene_type:complete